MIGRTPNSIEVIRFLDHGGVADEECARSALQFFLRSAGVTGMFGAGRAVVTIQSNGPATLRRGIKSLLTAAGLSRAALIDRSLAAALGVGVDIVGSPPVMIVDVGAGSTDIAIYSDGRLITGRTALIACHNVDEALINYFRRHHNLIISIGSIGRIKSNLIEQGEGGGVIVSGRDLMQGVPRESVFSHDQMNWAIEDVVRPIAEHVREAVQSSPENIRRKLLNVILVGGGALLPALKAEIYRVAGLEVSVPVDPLGVGIKGCGRLIDESGLDVFWSARNDLVR
jgi:rod shape-determining protein MreB